VLVPGAQAAPEHTSPTVHRCHRRRRLCR
jgi:hypothetical protein